MELLFMKRRGMALSFQENENSSQVKSVRGK
jgi:hypothetical protein